MRPAAPGMRSQRGFTLMEMMVAMGIMVTVMTVIFAMVDPSRGAYRVQPEISDMQQRMRIATQFLTDDLIAAGAGSPTGNPNAGTLTNFFAPLQPYRLGVINSDPANNVFYTTDTITLMHIPPNAPQTSIRDPMPQPSSVLDVQEQPNCPDNNPLCGFYPGQRIIIFDDTGAYDDLTITHVMPNPLKLQHNKSIAGNTLSKAYGIGAQIAVIAQRTFYRNAATDQLMYYDGDQRDEAVVDNVVDLVFEYFGEPRPPVIINPVTNPAGPWTSYGPKPPALGVTTNAWGPGENCAFTIGPSGTHTGRLADLAPGEDGLVGLSEEILTDGPWCPDENFPTRFDADLLRIRKVGVRLRVQVASAELRGPSAVLFRNPGIASASARMVPDQEIRFEIAPRNFNLGR